MWSISTRLNKPENDELFSIGPIEFLRLRRRTAGVFIYLTPPCLGRGAKWL